ncbi:MAG: family 1 extracellular solute-binding protein [Capsulimonas sp.]|jgi:multiple sugar transport system substrate-binding protein|nr:family 1 extracellular solute-binding protein [Capsulimonas sp.]
MMKEENAGWFRPLLRGLAVAAAIAAVTTVGITRQRLIAAGETPQAHKRIPVYYWHMWGGEWLPSMTKVVTDFNASQDKYEVIALQVPPAESEAKFLMSVAGGSPPDVMVQWTNAISTWSQGDVLQPLDTHMTPEEKRFFLNDTYPVVHENGWYKGHLYGMIINMDVNACYYRADQFREAGLDPDHFPKTLEELTAISRKLDRKDANGRFTRIGFLPASLQMYAPSFGGGFYDPAKDDVLLNTPENLRALNYIVDTNKQLGLDKVRRFNAGLKSQSGIDWPFIDGELSVTLDGQWRVKQIKMFKPDLDYRVAPLPPPAGGKPGASFSNVSFLTIPAGAKHSEGAWEFIKFWSGLDNPGAAAKYATGFSWLPSSPQMAKSPDYQAYLRENPKFQTFVDLAASPNIITTPPVPYQLYLMDRIGSVDDLAERGSLTPVQALTKLETDTARERARRTGLGYDQ